MRDENVPTSVSASTTTTAGAATKRSKRKRKSVPEDDASDVAVEGIVTVDDAATNSAGDAQQSVKKKRKKRNTDVLQENDVRGGSNVADVQEIADGTVGGGGGSSISAKKGKKKVDKGKGKEVVPPPSNANDIPIDPRLPGVNDNNAYLSAVIHAASASAGASTGAPTQAQLPYFTPYTYTTAPTDQQPFNMAAAAAFAQTGQNQIPSFLTDGSLPIADPNFAGLQNNEEVLRALQELDVTKLADVLRTFGQQNQLQGQSDEPQQQPIAPVLGNGEALHVGQLPAPSALLLGQPLRNPPKLPTSTAVSMPIAGTEENAEHAHLLSTRWLTPQKLAELVKTKGLIYKKGKFSVTEEEQIKQAIEQYQRQHDLTLEQIREKIFAKGMKDRDNAFWSEITSHVPQRPIIAVYHYVRRSYHPMKQQGKWTKEEDTALKQAVVELGQSWEKVSAKVGRMAGDCRDRWRNHINHAEDRVIGTWTSEEEDMLTRIVTEMTTEQGKDPDNEVFWTQVAAKMGNKRGRQQCRIKWTDALSKTVKNSGSKPRWSQQDAFILVHKIASFDVRDDSEIDWKLLNDEDWNLWSAHCLQRRWLSLKRSVKGYEEMSHQEIMDILRVKKSSLPSSPPPPRRSRVTSAPHVPSDVQQAEAEQAQAQAAAFVPQPQAGPSHMPFGIPHGHPGVMFAPPNMTFGGPGPSTMMNATHVVQAPAPAPAPVLPPVVPPPEVVEEEANTMFRNVMVNQEEPEAGSSSSSSESSEESSESSSEVSSTSSDDDSSDSDSD